MKSIRILNNLLLILLTGLVASASNADSIGDPIPSFYEEPGLSTNRDYEREHAQERIDPFTGKLQWHYVDLSIPGNGGFDLKVQRSYTNIGNPLPEATPFGVGWTVHFGRLLSASSSVSCLNGGSLVLELPDGSRQILYGPDAWTISPLTLVTTNLWGATCDGNGVTILSPDGTTYLMNYIGLPILDGNGS